MFSGKVTKVNATTFILRPEVQPNGSFGGATEGTHFLYEDKEYEVESSEVVQAGEFAFRVKVKGIELE